MREFSNTKKMLTSAMKSFFSGEDFFIFTLFCVYLLCLKIQALNIPLYSDEVLNYVIPGYNISLNGISILLQPSSTFHHPPGFPVLLSLFYSIVGEKVYSPRLLSLLTSAITLFYTYKLGQHFRDKLLGFLSAILLLCLPLFLSHTTLFLADPNFMALSTPFLYYIFTNRLNLAITLGLCMGLFRETSLAFGVGVFVYFMLMKKLNSKTMLASLSPFLTLGIFYLFERITTGHFLNHQAITDNHISFSIDHMAVILERGFIIFLETFWIQEKYILLYAFCFSSLLLLILSFRPKFHVQIPWKKFSSMLMIIMIFMIFFSLDQGFLNRYMLPVLPLYLMIILYPLICLGRWPAILFVAYYMFSIFPVVYDYSGRSGFITNMAYIHEVAALKQAASFLEKNYSQKIILAPWPLNPAVRYVFSGYTQRPLRTIDLTSLGSDQLPIAEYDVFVSTGFLENSFKFDSQKLISRDHLQLVKTINGKGKGQGKGLRISIYLNPHLNSHLNPDEKKPDNPSIKLSKSSP